MATDQGVGSSNLLTHGRDSCIGRTSEGHLIAGVLFSIYIRKCDTAASKSIAADLEDFFAESEEKEVCTMKMVTINMKQMKSEQEVYDFLKKELEFPEDFEGSVDELYAELLAMEENTCVEIVRAENDFPLAGFVKEMEGVMERAAQTVEFKEDRMYAVFADYEYIQKTAW